MRRYDVVHKSERTAISLTVPQMRLLVAEAERQGTSIAAVVRQSLRDFFENQALRRAEPNESN